MMQCVRACACMRTCVLGCSKKTPNAAWNGCVFSAAVPDLVAARVLWCSVCARVHACARLFWGVVKNVPNAAWNKCFFSAAAPDLVVARVW